VLGDGGGERKGEAIGGEEKQGREREGIGVFCFAKKHPYFPFFKAWSYIWNFVSFT
jgi:hypothetical protein